MPEPYYDDHEDDEITIKKKINNIAKTLPATVNWDNTKKEMKQTFGYPVLIGVLQ